MVNYSETLEDCLASIAGMSSRRICAKMMGRIGSASQFGRSIPACWWTVLEAHLERGQFKRFRKRFNRRQAKKHQPNRSPSERAPQRPMVTRTIHYRYDEADNARLDDFYQSREWRLMRYEALRLHGGRCQCCGASPEDGRTVLNVDHVKPLRVFWELRLEISNLQVLCGPCNEGKGARHADDWR